MYMIYTVGVYHTLFAQNNCNNKEKQISCCILVSSLILSHSTHTLSCKNFYNGAL